MLSAFCGTFFHLLLREVDFSQFCAIFRKIVRSRFPVRLFTAPPVSPDMQNTPPNFEILAVYFEAKRWYINFVRTFCGQRTCIHAAVSKRRDNFERGDWCVLVSLCYGTTLSSRVWCVYILWHRRVFYISRTTPKTAVHLRCLRCPSAGPSPGRALYRVPARSVSADGCGGGSAGGIRPLFAGGVFSVTILWYTDRKNAGGYYHGRNEPGPAGGRAGPP